MPYAGTRSPHGRRQPSTRDPEAGESRHPNADSVAWDRRLRGLGGDLVDCVFRL